jgi:hypothetical protein
MPLSEAGCTFWGVLAKVSKRGDALQKVHRTDRVRRTGLGPAGQDVVNLHQMQPFP